jgi:hypothetical protein
MTFCDQGPPCERSTSNSSGWRINIVELGNVVVGVALALALSDIARKAHSLDVSSTLNRVVLPSLIISGIFISFWLLYGRIASAVVNLKIGSVWIRDLSALATLVPLQLIIVSAQFLPDSIGQWYGLSGQIALLAAAAALVLLFAITSLCVRAASNPEERRELFCRGTAALAIAVLLVALFLVAKTSFGALTKRVDLGAHVHNTSCNLATSLRAMHFARLLSSRERRSQRCSTNSELSAPRPWPLW